jgi:hypothetical protein
MNQGLLLLLYYCHSNISFVAYKVLFINDAILNYVILNNVIFNYVI